MNENINYRAILNHELELRKKKNPAYTTSAFAKLLGLSGSRMSEILKGKIGISVQRAIDICEKLKLNTNDRKKFITLVQSEHERSPVAKRKAQKKIAEFNDDYAGIDDVFSSIADWYHHAIIEFISLHENTSINITSLAKRLNLSPEQTQTAINRLVDLKLINKTSADEHSYKLNTSNRDTKRDIPSEAVKILNEQILDKAKKELRLQPVDQRDYTIAFFGLSKSQIDLAKDRIETFRRGLMKELEISTNRDSVYCLSIQMFEVINSGEKNENI